MKSGALNCRSDDCLEGEGATRMGVTSGPKTVEKRGGGGATGGGIGNEEGCLIIPVCRKHN